MSKQIKILDSTNEAVMLEKREDGIAVITLNRPHAMNAVNSDLATGLGQALREVDIDDELRVSVVTGSGRAFSAGADLKAIAVGADIGAVGHPEWGFAGIVNHTLRKPVIAAVNGFALGGGTEIMLSCDLAVMSSQATLGLPEVKRGLFAAAGGLVRLPRHLPPKVAMRAALTGDPITAEEALRWGLVNEVVDPEDVLDQALALAALIAGNAPLAVQASKAVVLAGGGESAGWTQDVWKLNDEKLGEVFGSRDAMEGATAFAEKRAPKWTGR